MGIIRDRQFRIPKIFPQIIRHNFEESENRPILIQGVDIVSGSEGYYVIKPSSARRMYPGASMKELIASLLALELDMLTPYPVIIQVDDEFIETTKGSVNYLTLSQCKGLNFGNSYLPGYSTFSEAHFKLISLYFSIQSTFIFDVFIENIDRSRIKPNILTDGDKLYVIDHELAFSFTDLIFPSNTTPWLLSENDKEMYRVHHLFYQFLLKKNFICDDFMDRLSNLDEVFWESIYYYLPDDWRHEKFALIKEHLILKISKINIFRDEIKRFLL